MEIHNRVELFYAANILTKNNLSELMINIDPNLLKGNKKYFFLVKKSNNFILLSRKKHYSNFNG
jgi:hypothetical protein